MSPSKISGEDFGLPMKGDSDSVLLGERAVAGRFCLEVMQKEEIPDQYEIARELVIESQCCLPTPYCVIDMNRSSWQVEPEKRLDWEAVSPTA